LSKADVWNEAGSAKPAIFDPKEDTQGPAIVGLATNWRGPEAAHPARLVVVGDSDFVRNAVLDANPGNERFAVNSVRWLVGEDDRIGPIAQPMGGSIGKAMGVRRRWTDGQLAAMRWGVLACILALLVLSGRIVDFWVRWRARSASGLSSGSEE